MESNMTTKNYSHGTENALNNGQYSMECIQSHILNMSHPSKWIVQFIKQVQTQLPLQQWRKECLCGSTFCKQDTKMASITTWTLQHAGKKMRAKMIHRNVKESQSTWDRQIVITAIIDHGRIQVQGKSYKQWGNELLLEIINSDRSCQ
jgi:hypothetical protein